MIKVGVKVSETIMTNTTHPGSGCGVDVRVLDSGL